MVIPAWLSQTNARWLALISTGSVMKLNTVVEAKRMIPNSISCGNVCNISMPPSKTQVMMFEAKLTTGTKAERIRSGA